MRSNISFKGKMVLVIAAVMLIFGALAAVVAFQMTERTISRLSLKYLESIVVQQGAVVESVFENSRSFVHHLASQRVVVEYLEHATPQGQDPELLEHFENFDADERYQAIYVMDRTGKTLTSTDPAFVGQNYGFRKYFSAALAGVPTIDAAIGVTSGRFGYYFSYPVRNASEEVVGVVVAKLKESLIADVLHPRILSPEGNAMLVDSYGVVIQSDRPELLLKSLGTLSQSARKEIAEAKRFGGIEIVSLGYEPIMEVLTGAQAGESLALYDALHERDEIVGLVRINESPFFIFIEETRASFAQTAGRVALVVGLLILLATLAGALTLITLVSRLLRPLAALKNASIRLHKNDYAQSIAIKSGDEFEDLGDVLNAMTGKLRDVYGNIEEKIWERAADFEKFKLAVESASDHIIITDLDGRILYANKAAEEVTGYSREEMIGNRPSLWGKQMSQEYYADMWKIIKTEKRVFHGEATNKRKSGEIYEAEVHITPLLMDKGLLYGFVGIERDITLRKEIDRAKTEFVSIASHQLRTPLAVVNWYIEMLTKQEVGPINAEQKKYLEQIYLASRRMVDLVNSLLSVSRIDMGAFYVEPEMLDLTNIADSVLEDLQHLSIKKGITIKKKYDPKLPKINADPSLTRVIFQNLLANAIKYTPEKGSVSITIEKKDEQNALITISDTGYGIPANQHSKIFTKFFRADNAREKEPDGNGLGLYIVKAIVDSAEGAIWFTSKEGAGATFFISLPLSGMKRRAGHKPLVP